MIVKVKVGACVCVYESKEEKGRKNLNIKHILLHTVLVAWHICKNSIFIWNVYTVMSELYDQNSPLNYLTMIIFFVQLYKIKYSNQAQIICIQLYGIKYSYLTQIICTNSILFPQTNFISKFPLIYILIDDKKNVKIKTLTSLETFSICCRSLTNLTIMDSSHRY